MVNLIKNILVTGFVIIYKGTNWRRYNLLLVCKKHIKEGLQYLNAPHIVTIKDENFKGCCVFCNQRAEYKLFYSIPISKSHRIQVQEMIQKTNLN